LRSRHELLSRAFDTGSARDADRQVQVRLDPDAYAALAKLAFVQGLAPTTMARMLFRKALDDAISEAANNPLP